MHHFVTRSISYNKTSQPPLRQGRQVGAKYALVDGMNPSQHLRLVVIVPDSLYPESGDERSRSLRIGLLENGFNLIATLPAAGLSSERIRPVLEVAELLA